MEFETAKKIDQDDRYYNKRKLQIYLPRIQFLKICQLSGQATVHATTAIISLVNTSYCITVIIQLVQLICNKFILAFCRSYYTIIPL